MLLLPHSLRIVAGTLLLGLPMAQTAGAAAFDLFEAGTETRLGGFEAPEAGGPVTAFDVALLGGVFDVLGTGSEAIRYRADENDLDGSFGIGAAFNSNLFPATTVGGDAVICTPGDCAFEVDTSFPDDGTPGDWGLQFVPPGDPSSAANIATGYYEVRVAPVPAPATGALLAAGLLALGGRAARRRSRAA